MNVFLARIIPNKLFPDRNAERCRKKYLGNMDLLVDRYLHIAEKRVETARLKYADPVQYAKHKAIISATQRRTLATIKKQPIQHKQVRVYTTQYDEALDNFCLGSFLYLGNVLEIYKKHP